MKKTEEKEASSDQIKKSRGRDEKKKVLKCLKKKNECPETLEQNDFLPSNIFAKGRL